MAEGELSLLMGIAINAVLWMVSYLQQRSYCYTSLSEGILDNLLLSTVPMKGLYR